MAIFPFVRHGNLLVVMVNVPLTLQGMRPLVQYQLVKMPLLAPNAPGYYSELVTDFEPFAYHNNINKPTAAAVTKLRFAYRKDDIRQPFLCLMNDRNPMSKGRTRRTHYREWRKKLNTNMIAH